ncbi:MAG: ABC transporter ATP-binding protein/permease [Fimbriimonadales bacterium]|nr:ABC transporter ATP-binding protein/permease [Fimbriimonadales bacterium]
MARDREGAEETESTEYRRRSSLRRLWPELRPFLGLQVLCAVLTIAQSAFGFIPPKILGDIVNQLQRGEPINAVAYLLWVVGFAVGQGLLGYGLGVATATLGQRFLIATRQKLYRHMQSLPLAFFEKNQTGKLISNVINDAATVQNLITGNLNTMLSDFVQLALVLVVLFWIHPVLALLSLSIAPLYVWNFLHFQKPLQKTSESIRAKRDVMYGDMQEKLVGIQVVKSFGQERWEARTFMGTTRALMNLNVLQASLGGGLWTIADALCGIGQGLVLWYGGREVLAGRMEPGTLVMFLIYSIGYVYGPIVRFLIVIDPIARTQAALNRIFRTLDTPNTVADKPGAQPMPPIRGRVDFEGVWFEYEPGQPVLKGIDLHVEPGQMVALVGFSGSGKTTMISLLLRHYDPKEGRILVDGVDLRDTQLLSYRSQLGVVMQESILFNTTILENIRYGKMDATEEEVQAAAIAANIHDAILSLPDGYQTRIGEDGVKLSVGEKQRLAIARALLADPKILILDEATSALDSQTEALLQAALDNLLKGRTSFVIAHRLSTIVKADQIVVLEKGRIVEKGTHAELLEHGGVYANLYNEQFRVALQSGPA